MLQIGLSGLLTYVKASQRSTIINDLLLSKDYISEIITMAADHFPNVCKFELRFSIDENNLFIGSIVISNMFV